jgi:hypothetical protein
MADIPLPPLEDDLNTYFIKSGLAWMASFMVGITIDMSFTSILRGFPKLPNYRVDAISTSAGLISGVATYYHVSNKMKRMRL